MRQLRHTQHRGPCAASLSTVTSRRARQLSMLITVVLLSATAPRTLRGQAAITGTTRATGPTPPRQLRPDSALHLHALYASVSRSNPRIEAAAAFARAAAARVAAAGKPPDPEVQFALMNYSLPRLAPDAVLGMRQVQLMQMLPLPGKLSAASDGARARAQAENARATDVTWEVRVTTAMAFYALWSARERIRIATQTRRLLDDAAAIATSMYAVGDGRQADVLRARVEIARMDEEIMRMGVMADAARARIAAVIDRPDSAVSGQPVLPLFPDSIPPRQELEDAALRARPMLAAGALSVRAAEADERLASRERWPDVRLGLQYGERSMAMGTDRMGSLMIGAAIPLFARARQLRMRDEAAAMRAMTVADLRAMQAETRARIAEVSADLRRARRLGALYRNTILPQAEAASASALASYRSGGVDFMTVLENRMTVNRYHGELVTLTADEGGSWAELEMLLGRAVVAPPSER